MVFLWKQALSMNRTGLNKHNILKRLAEATNDPNILQKNLTTKACSKALRVAQKELKENEKNHEILRQQFPAERQIELSNDPSQKDNQQIVLRIQGAEEKRRSHAHIKVVMTGSTKGGLTHPSTKRQQTRRIPVRTNKRHRMGKDLRPQINRAISTRAE